MNQFLFPQWPRIFDVIQFPLTHPSIHRLFFHHPSRIDYSSSINFTFSSIYKLFIKSNLIQMASPGPMPPPPGTAARPPPPPPPRGGRGGLLVWLGLGVVAAGIPPSHPISIPNP